MKMYFVDYENINGKSLKPTLDISRGDIVFIFYTNACRNISDSTIKLIGDKGGFLKTFKVKNGVRNALDFQLSSYIGYIISKNFFANYKLIIVSGDKGYDVVCDFWRKRDIIKMLFFPSTFSPAQSNHSIKILKNGIIN